MKIYIILYEWGESPWVDGSQGSVGAKWFTTPDVDDQYF